MQSSAQQDRPIPVVPMLPSGSRNDQEHFFTAGPVTPDEAMSDIRKRLNDFITSLTNRKNVQLQLRNDVDPQVYARVEFLKKMKTNIKELIDIAEASPAMCRLDPTIWGLTCELQNFAGKLFRQVIMKSSEPVAAKQNIESVEYAIAYLKALTDTQLMDLIKTHYSKVILANREAQKDHDMLYAYYSARIVETALPALDRSSKKAAEQIDPEVFQDFVKNLGQTFEHVVRMGQQQGSFFQPSAAGAAGDDLPASRRLSPAGKEPAGSHPGKPVPVGK